MTTPEDLADTVLRTVARLNRWATMHASWELPPAQIRLLALIEELEPARITDLAEADHTSQPGITAQVNRLEGARLVTRTTAPGDARVHRVTTTPEGRDLLRRMRSARAEMLAPAFARLDADDLAAIRRTQQLLSELIAQPPEGPA